MGDVTKTLFGASLSLLAGFLYVHTSYYRRFACEYLKTDRFGFLLLVYSLSLFLVGALAAEKLHDVTPQWFQQFRVDAESIGISATLVNAFVGALILAFAENFYHRWRMKSDPILAATLATKGVGRFTLLLTQMRLGAQARYVGKTNDSFLRVLFRAKVLNKFLQVSMKSGKVYVGDLKWFEIDPASPLTHIYVIPAASGFRNKDNQSVKDTIDYRILREGLSDVPPEDLAPIDPETAERISSDPWRSDFLILNNDVTGEASKVDMEDFGILLPVAEIASMTIHDEAVYEWFRDHPKEVVRPLPPPPAPRWRATHPRPSIYGRRWGM